MKVYFTQQVGDFKIFPDLFHGHFTRCVLTLQETQRVIVIVHTKVCQLSEICLHVNIRRHFSLRLRYLQDFRVDIGTFVLDKHGAHVA